MVDVATERGQGGAMRRNVQATERELEPILCSRDHPDAVILHHPPPSSTNLHQPPPTSPTSTQPPPTSPTPTQPPPSPFRLLPPRWGTAARRETTVPRAASSCPPRRATGRRHARRWRGVGVLRGCGAPTHWCFSPP